jgi:hypothetical protein
MMSLQAGHCWMVMRVRAISSTSRRATTRHPGRRLGRIDRRSDGMLRPGCRVVGRCQVEEMALRLPALGGAFPERTTYPRPARAGTRRHEAAAQASRDDTGRASRSRRVRFDTEEVALAGRAGGLRDGRPSDAVA